VHLRGEVFSHAVCRTSIPGKLRMTWFGSSAGLCLKDSSSVLLKTPLIMYCRLITLITFNVVLPTNLLLAHVLF